MDLDCYKPFLKINYPQTFQFLCQTKWSPLFFNKTIHLPINIYRQTEKIVQNFYQLRNNTNYQKKLLNQYQSQKDFLNLDKNQDSVLMAYDFHFSDNLLKLIEINTNASAFLLVNSLYQIKNLNYKQALTDLKHSFQKEWNKFNTKRRLTKIALIDENPLNQKMLIEFFMYKDFFQSINWDMEILDPKQLKTDSKHCLYNSKGEKIDFIYNRLTDFYFKNYPMLAQAYRENTCLILPQPKDYFFLSDKMRGIEWLNEDWPELRDIKNSLLQTIILNPNNKEKIWKTRKKYFFKISQGHGGKMVYNGKSLSRKKFEEMLPHNILAQEYIAPSKITDSNGRQWKLDLRAYVYKDKIQQLAGRVYQGQLTNFKAAGSGFATVQIV